MAPTIAIIGALEKEVRQVYNALAEGSIVEEAGLSVAQGSYCGMHVVATVAGMGTVNAAAATQHLISRYGASTVIFSGIAGGLNPALHIGDVVLGAHLRYLDTDTALIAESTPSLEEFESSANLLKFAEEELAELNFVQIDGAQNRCEADGSNDEGNASKEFAATDTKLQYLRGTIATGDRFITGADVKQQVIAATQADCVEMEGAAVAHIAAKNGAQCLVLRAISDNCDESYDALSSREFDLNEYAATASSLVLGIIRRMAHEPRKA